MTDQDDSEALRATPANAGGELCTYGPPSERKPTWIVMFDDPDRGSAIFDNESEAIEYWKRAKDNWTCKLLTTVRIGPPKDAGSDAQCSREDVRALMDAVRLFHSVIRSGEQWSAECGQVYERALTALGALRSSLTNPSPKDAGGWQAIETAPRDGKYIIITNGRLVDVARWSHGSFGGWDATHWQPLPAPPATATPQGEGETKEAKVIERRGRHSHCWEDLSATQPDPRDALIAQMREALEDIALLDEADGHELKLDHAYKAIAIATKTLDKHPSEISADRRSRVRAALSSGEGDSGKTRSHVSSAIGDTGSSPPTSEPRGNGPTGGPTKDGRK